MIGDLCILLHLLRSGTCTVRSQPVPSTCPFELPFDKCPFVGGYNYYFMYKVVVIVLNPLPASRCDVVKFAKPVCWLHPMVCPVLRLHTPDIQTCHRSSVCSKSTSLNINSAASAA
jgi:hypothetical protein